MSRLWNLVEAHYLIAGFLLWVIVIETSKIIRQFLRTIQFHPDYHTHNHITQVQNEDDTEEEDEGGEEDNELTSSQNPMLTRDRPQPIPRPGRTSSPRESSPGLLTRAERVLRNLRG